MSAFFPRAAERSRTPNTPIKPHHTKGDTALQEPASPDTEPLTFPAVRAALWDRTPAKPRRSRE